MKWTGLNELREAYLSFFESKGHLRLPSFPLVPINDNSLFLINSGMAPMKKYFLGQEIPPRNRVTTCQKCIRTPDIENVGKTARHGTYFEMLGNFSFGDYFKHEATQFAWEFCTKVLELPVDRLWVSIFQDDDEARDIWVNEVGVDPSHIVRMGKEDNFWEHGTGPCGPCSEIYFDRGPAKGCGKPDCKVGCDCDRYVEFWNLVFSQFDSDGAGTYTPLDRPNIDTGMGLERLACILQEVDNLFEVDTMQAIMGHISKIAGVTYHDDPKADISLRVITDHIRSTTFMIGDGVIPSNEGRGYVLRRLLRRAARHGRLLGINRPFLSEVVSTVIRENLTAYPELAEKEGYICRMVKNEEESFSKTVDKGLALLSQLLENTKSGDMLSGEDVFRLYDTYGFPLDLTRDIAEEQGVSVDEEGFTALMTEQRVRARNARATGDAFGGGSDALAALAGETTVFEGYETLTCQGKVLAILYEGEREETAIAPQHITLITDRTPFYAESGGQVSDPGEIRGEKCTLKVTDVKKSGGLILHSCEMLSGELSEGETVTLSVCGETRAAVARNHTAAHLLQAALRSVLGEHVHQAGQLVDGNRMRFDFSHFEAVTPEELAKIEAQVNAVILQNIPVERYETDIATAKEQGAMALFGEKYGDVVRVCKVGDYSLELCGGTHVENTGKLGLFKIISESSVAAGVRRIEAATGYGVLELLANANTALRQAADTLKLANVGELQSRCQQVMNELKEKNVQIESLSQRLADSKLAGLLASGKEVTGVQVIAAVLDQTDSDGLRILGDKIKAQLPTAVALLVGKTEAKCTMLCICGSEAVAKGGHAGKLVGKAAAITGGKGGGRPDSAMAGVNDRSRLSEAVDSFAGLVAEMLG